MEDYLGSIIDLRNLHASLQWLRAWAKREWTVDSVKSTGAAKKEDMNNYSDEDLSGCPHPELGIYALTALRPDIIRRKGKKGILQIAVGLLAEIKL